MNIAIKRKKRILGLFYGLFGGAAFSVTAWGFDGWLLSHAHAAFPWLNFIAGLMICIIVAALAGWLTARLDSSMIGILVWMSVACLLLGLRFGYLCTSHLTSCGLSTLACEAGWNFLIIQA